MMRWWSLIAGLLAATYLPRASFIVLSSHVTLPEIIRRALRYVPAAALTAVFLPPLAMPAGTLDLGPGNLRPLAGVVAAIVAWKTRSSLWTIGAGWGTLILLDRLLH